MTKTLEERVAALEKELAEIKARPWLSPPVKKDPWATFGSAKDDSRFEEANQLGEEYRVSQTWEKEGRGGAGH